MREYRIVDELEENMGRLEDLLNEAARIGFRPVLMAANADGLIKVLMERDQSKSKEGREA